MTLTGRTAGGIRWSLLSQIVRQAVTIGTLAALTRMLPPRDFGLLSMGLVVLTFVNLFSDLGTSAAVVQRAAPTQRLLSTTFWTNLALGTLATGLVAAAAPLVARFYRTPDVVGIVRLMSISFVLLGAGLVQQALLVKGLRFKQLAVIETGAAVCGSAAALSAAGAGAGAYSLVAQVLVTAMLTSTGVWIASEWRPSRAFSIDDLRSLRKFSSNLVGFNLVNYFARNADYLLIGRYLGAQSLAYYTLGYNLLLLPLQMLTYVVSRVMFPAYSLIQEDSHRIARAYRRTVFAISTVTFPLMLGLLVTADLVVRVVYGSHWSRAVPVVMLLAPVGAIQSIVALNGSIYQAKSRTDLQLRVGVVFSAMAVISFFVGLHWGIVGVAAAYAVATAVATPYPLLAVPLRLVGLKLRDVASDLRGPVVSSAVTAAAVALLRLGLPSTIPAAARLTVLVAFATAVYPGAAVLLSRSSLRETWGLFRAAQGAA